MYVGVIWRVFIQQLSRVYEQKVEEEEEEEQEEEQEEGDVA